MQQPFDAAAKALIDAALAGVCEVQLQAPVTPDALYIDALVSPIASEAMLLTRGLLGRIALTDCAIEMFAETPARFDVDHCVARALFLAVKRRRPHRLWVISPGVPKAAIEAWDLSQRSDWPRGVYLGATSAMPSVVVLAQLPRSRDTLLLRLMGSGSLLREAVDEARSLDRSSRDRKIIDHLLLQMKRDLDRMMRSESKPSEELSMRYAELVKINEQERAEMRAAATAEGLAVGWANGLSEGHAEGHAEGLREAIFDICELLGIVLAEAQRAAVARMPLGELEALRQSIKRERRWPA